METSEAKTFLDDVIEAEWEHAARTKKIEGFVESYEPYTNGLSQLYAQGNN